MKKCRLCPAPATRVTHFYSLETEHLSFWSRLIHGIRKGRYFTEAVCDKCHLVCVAGIDTITCEYCGKDSLFKYDTLFDTTGKITCWNCGCVLVEPETEGDD